MKIGGFVTFNANFASPIDGSCIRAELLLKIILGLAKLNPIPREGGGGIYAPLPHFSNFLRKYLSEEAPTIL